MVDFNNEKTIGTPAVDVVRILILQRHSDLLEALEHYNKQKYNGVRASLCVVRARLMSLFLQLQPAIKRKCKNEDEYNIKLDLFTSDQEKEVNEAVLYLNEFLDELRLTRIDTKSQYDSTRVEFENKEKGL